MDTAYHALELAFESSLHILATVIGVKGGLVTTDTGLKSASTDQRPPRFAEYPEAKLSFSEEHSVFRVEEVRHGVGDRLHMVPSHCCTTVNLHDAFYLVRGDTVVDKVPVTSRGKSR